MPPLTSNLQLSGMLITALLVGALAVLLPLFIMAYVFLQRFATVVMVESLEKRVETEIDKIERHMLAEIATSRLENAGQNTAIMQKLDGLNGTVQLFTNETARQTGFLEGRVVMIEKIAEAKLERPL